MGKIRKQFLQEKHGATLSPFISEFISKAVSLPLFRLSSHLKTLPQDWPFPRGDFYHWIGLLNRFDEILDQLITSYKLDQGPQLNEFANTLTLKDFQDSKNAVGGEASATDATDDAIPSNADLILLQDIIDFTRILHENCGNRSLYASSDRLNHILNTNSLPLLEKTLRLAHRLAQRYTAARIRNQGPTTHLGPIRQSILAVHYAIDLHKLEAMVAPLEWEDAKTGSSTGVEATDSTTPTSHSLPESLSDMQILGEEVKSSELLEVAQELTTQPAVDGAKETYTVYHRLRSLYGMARSREGRIESVSIRLLAIANLAQIYPETTLQEKALRFYNDKPRHQQLPQLLCELVHPPGRSSSKVPRRIQTYAMLTLESLMNHKTKSAEVGNALNVSVNHGPLASALRQAVNHIIAEGDQCTVDDSDWLVELFSLLHALIKSNGRAFEGLLSAGLVDMLVEILRSKSSKAGPRHAAALSLLTVFMYSSNDAFGSFVNAGGLDVVSELLVFEINLSLDRALKGLGMPTEYKTQVTDYQIPFIQQQCIRGIFKFVYSMLGMAGGPFDRLLRNLIEDSNILTVMRRVIEHAEIFGSNVWTNCISVFSTFINNEPTSFNAIAEAGIPTAILESIVQPSLAKPDQIAHAGQAATSPQPDVTENEASPTIKPIPYRNAGGILPACEAVNIIPDAFGAMCLNEAGMRQFEDSGALETLFGIFTSPAHVKAFESSIGSDIERLAGSIEQLHRHNRPSFGTTIIALVIDAAQKVAELVSSAPVSGLLPDKAAHQDGKAPTEDVEMSDTTSATPSSLSESTTSTYIYVNVFSKFLATLFRSPQCCDTFTNRGGLDSLLTMACAPGLSRTSDSRSTWSSLHKFADVIRHMAENKPFLVIPPLIHRIRLFLERTKLLTNHGSDSSFLLPMTEVGPDVQLEDSERSDREVAIRSLVTIKLLVECLTKSLQPTLPTTPTRGVTPCPLTTANVADMLRPLIFELGNLQTKLLWEQQLCNVARFTSTLSTGTKLPATGHGDSSNGLSSTNPSPALAPVERTTLSATRGMASYLGKRLLTKPDVAMIAMNYPFSLPMTVVELFGKISSTIVPRKFLDGPTQGPYSRQQVFNVANQLAGVLVDRLKFSFPEGTSEKTMVAFQKSNIDCMKTPLLGTSHRDWPSQSRGQLQTVVVRAFLQMDGIKLMGHYAKFLMEQSVQNKEGENAESLRLDNQSDEPGQALVRCLAILAALAEDKPLLSSTQTTALNTLRDIGDPYHFQTGQFLLELRLQVIRAVSDIWTSDHLQQLPSATIKLLARLFSTILEGSSDMGYSRSQGIRRPQPPSHKQWKVRSEQLATLELEGFPKDLAVEALYRCFSAGSAAHDYCEYFTRFIGHRDRYPLPEGDIEPDREATASAEPGLLDRDDEDEDQAPSQESLIPDGATGATITTQASHTDPAVSSGVSPSPQATAQGQSAAVTQTELAPTNEDLDEEREQLRLSLMDRCLSLSGSFEDVIFEMGDLILASIVKASDQAEMRRDISTTLSSSLMSYVGSDNLHDEAKKVSGISHLLGVVLQNSDFFDAARDELKDSFSILTDLLPVPMGSKPSVVAPWIPQILLLLEFILAEDVQPQQIPWETPSADNPREERLAIEPRDPMVTDEEKKKLFDQLLDLMPKVGKELDLGVSIVRVLVILTRTRALATTLAEKRNMQKFLLLVKQLAPSMTDRLKSGVMIVLRHIVEDEETIRRLIRSDIKGMLDRPPRPVDTSRYVRDLYHDVLRAPDLFVEVTGEVVELNRFDNVQSHQILTLKKPPSETPVDTDMTTTASKGETKAVDSAGIEVTVLSPEQPDAETKSKTAELKAPIVENPDGVIHFLLCELLTYKEVEDKKTADPQKPANADVENPPGHVDMDVDENPPTPATPTTPATAAPARPQSEPLTFNPEDHPIYVYRCFLLNALSELLASYNRAKVEMINFSRKADPQASTPSKPRSGVLNYLLNGLLPTGSIEHASEMDAKKKASVSSSAIGTIVALCARTTENGIVNKTRHSSEPEDDEPDLLFVRRFVLEHALKAFKDSLVSSEPAAIKYSKLIAMADLFNRMLAGRPAPQPGYRRSNSQDDNMVPTNKQVARIMFEKNFISILTSSLSDVDLNLAGSHRVIKYILRPLKLLTHTAIELSLSSDLSSSPGTTTDEDEISSATSVSDNLEREETPDLFRNSTLGMFDPSRAADDDSQSEEESDDDEEDDQYGDAYADDMEFDEADEDEPDAGEVVSDEEMEGHEDIEMEGLNGDVPIDVEIDMEESGTDEEEIDESGDEDAEMEYDSMDSVEESAGEDEGSDIEVLDEITGDDENASLDEGGGVEGQWQEDEDADIQLLNASAPFPADESHSEADLEPFTGVVMDEDIPHEHLELDIEGVDAEGEGESGEDDEEEEDEYDEEIMYREAEDDDSEMPPYIFNPWPNAPGGRRGHPMRPGFMPRADGDIFGFADPIFGGAEYRSHRPQVGRGNEITDGTNPLLDRARRPQTASGSAAGRSGHIHTHSVLPHQIANLISRFDDMAPGSNPEQYRHLTHLIQALGNGALGTGSHGHHHGSFQLRIGGGTPADPHSEYVEIQIQTPEGLAFPFSAQPPSATRHNHLSTADGPLGLTCERWQEEARLIFGAQHVDKSLKVVNSLLRLLIPPAMQAENLRVKKANEEVQRRAKERARLEVENNERLEREKKEQEELEARQKAEAEEAVAVAAAAEAATREAEAVGETSTTTTTAEAAPNAMEGIESTAEPTTVPATTNEAEPPAAERIFIELRGARVDITNLGIDLDYLEALPEEMREEVITQQFADHRSQAAAAGDEPSEYDNEFLNALPPEIRTEILTQERLDRRRREREEARHMAAAATGQPAQAEEMDPASFMASLDPALRAQVLAEADEEMLASLPADLAAEARALGGHHRRRALDPARLMADIDHLTGLGPSRAERRHELIAESRAPRRPIVQMLEKTGIVTLLRLMFVPIPSNSRQTLNAILRNVSGNHQTRSEIVSGLLTVLQEGTVDNEAVLRSFSHITSRAKQVGSNKTPSKKVETTDVTLHNEANPRLVIGNCLASLIFLTQSITHIPKFFLTEHELVTGSKGKLKSKGKARDTRASRIPLNALLGLLDREVVIDNSQLIEQLAGLLQSVTQPLSLLLKKEKEPHAEKVAEVDGNATQQAVEAGPGPSDAGESASSANPISAVAPIVEEPSSSEAADTTTSEAAADAQSTAAASKKPFVAPEIPEENLRLIINILTARDCGGKTFRDTLSTINNLSSIPDAREAFGKELVKRARKLGYLIAADLAHLAKDFRGAGDEMEAQSMALTRFSPTESNQSKLNRILTALDYLFDAKHVDARDNANKNANGLLQTGSDLLLGLHEDPTFTKVWNELSRTLGEAHEVLAKGQQSDKTYLNVATILLPLIESLMVVCKRLELKDARTANLLQRASAPTTPAPESTMKLIFFNFTNKHRKILNDLVRSNPKLMSGSFSVLVKNSSVLEFDNKRNYFNRKLHHRPSDIRNFPHPSLQISVRRDVVFTDSYRSLYFKKPDEMKYGKLNIRFHNEEGVDAGGVTREWFQVLSRQMFDPSYALFNPVASDKTTFHPNPQSAINDSHLNYFNFIGRIIGKALYENRVLDCHFSRAVYKRILGKAVSLKDMETIDLDYSKSLQWMLDNDITDIITETFSITSDYFGVQNVIDLIDNGNNIAVTEENKHEYVRLVIEYKLTGSVKDQLENFLQGFHDIVPAELIAIFDEGELELLISGMPEIDIFDWKSNTDYQNYNVNSPQIQWFWRAVRSFDKEERAKLLQFITGTGKVPLNGFKELEGMNGVTRFSIHKDYGNKDRLPSSHTCFNQLDLPEYDSYEALRKALYTAMTTGGEYFGFA